MRADKAAADFVEAQMYINLRNSFDEIMFDGLKERTGALITYETKSIRWSGSRLRDVVNGSPLGRSMAMRTKRVRTTFRRPCAAPRPLLFACGHRRIRALMTLRKIS